MFLDPSIYHFYFLVCPKDFTPVKCFWKFFWWITSKRFHACRNASMVKAVWISLDAMKAGATFGVVVVFTINQRHLMLTFIYFQNLTCMQQREHNVYEDTTIIQCVCHHRRGGTRNYLLGAQTMTLSPAYLNNFHII